MLEKKTLVEVTKTLNVIFLKDIPKIFLKSYMKILNAGWSYAYNKKSQFHIFTLVFINRILKEKFRQNDYKNFNINKTLLRFDNFYNRILKSRKHKKSPNVHFTFSCSQRLIMLFMQTEKSEF